MSIVTFLLLILIAAIAAGAYVMVLGAWVTRTFVAAFVFGALLLVLPTLLPLLLGA
jgi:hypothetical protein